MNEKYRAWVFWGAAAAVALIVFAFWLGRQLPGATVALPPPVETVEEQTVSEPVNVNTASVKELQELPGVGETIAKEIVRRRSEVGAFSSIWDLEDVAGIGESKMQTLAPLVTVE